MDFEAAVTHLRTTDPLLARAIDRVGPCRLECRSGDTLFEAILRSIVYQQLSGHAARTIHARVRRLGRQRRLSPARLEQLSDGALRAAGLSRGKIAAVRDLSSKVLDGSLPHRNALHAMPDEEVIAALSGIRGVGRWTAEMILMFTFRRPDVLPATDLGIRKGFQQVYRRRHLPPPESVLRAGQRWRPYRSVASWYLWRVLEAD